MKKRLKTTIAYIWKEIGRLKKLESQKHVVPILYYHSVSSEPTHGQHRVTDTNFEDQVRFLTSNYTVMPFSQFIENLRNQGKMTKCAVVTFDDGYRDNYQYAYPILKKYSCPAAIFIATGFIEKTVTLIEDEEILEPMTWKEINEMNMNGLISFGAHGHTHRILSQISRYEVEEEIKTSKNMIEENLGKSINIFAYPNGQPSDFNQEIINVLKNNGFIAACSTVWGSTHSYENAFAIRRIMVERSDSIDIFKLKLMGAYDFLCYVSWIKFVLHRMMKVKGNIIHRIKT